MENGKILLEIRLSSPDQIFTPYSPIPFNEHELNSVTEDYIVETVRDFPEKAEFRIVLRVPAAIARSPACQVLPDAIRNHFRYRMLALDRRYRQWIRFGKKTLVIAIVVLALATYVSHAILEFSETLPAQMVSDGASIVGWVAMWAPATVLLLELWPVRETKRLYERIISMEIVVAPAP
ncbi:hypothetical protein [Methanoregula sp.]|uniref:hypothetical protein n=1 Tax=Methanoregula sp. TaxID=2052170 RepID=UPI0035660711